MIPQNCYIYSNVNIDFTVDQWFSTLLVKRNPKISSIVDTVWQLLNTRVVVISVSIGLSPSFSKLIDECKISRYLVVFVSSQREIHIIASHIWKYKSLESYGYSLYFLRLGLKKYKERLHLSVKVSHDIVHFRC